MTSSPPETSPAIASALARSVNFELTLADGVRRSERRAWMVASCAMGMALLLAGGYVVVLPLKEKVPYLVMADAFTGTSTVARLSGDFNQASITASEAINRSNIAHFVLARESYDYALIRLRDWTTVYTMASPGVAAGYTRLHAATNPESPYNLYGKSRAIRVSILSIQLLGGEHGTPQGASIRFQRSVYDSGDASSRPLDSRIATLQFAYKANLSMDEKDRIENPLGFQVTSYRVDNDYAASPPVQRDDTGSARAPEFSTQALPDDGATTGSIGSPGPIAASATSSQAAADPAVAGSGP
jgi:type IV secretion system protein VirB8